MKNFIISIALIGGAALLPLHAATMASQPWTTNRIAEAEARVNARITSATNAIPAPGDYANVSNRAMSALQSHQPLTPATNYTDAALGAFAATGSVARAFSYGTHTWWVDATGCVWEVVLVMGQWTRTQGPSDVYVRWHDGDDAPPYTISGAGWYIQGDYQWPQFVNNDTSATRLSDTLQNDGYYGQGVVASFVRELVPEVNLVTRVAYTNDIPEWPIGLVTTNSPILFADGDATNVPSVAIHAGPTNYSALSFMTPVSWYLPNRFSLLELGHDYQIAAAQWLQVGRFLYAPSPDRIVFFGGERHKTLQEYLDACSPETVSDLLGAYVPTNGGARIHGDLEIDGQLKAGALITITNSDIHAKGFQVVDRVLTADGLFVSNGMVRINCARVLNGLCTARIHLETNSPQAITYGGTWEHPQGSVFSWQSELIEQFLAGDVTNQNIEARNPYVRYGDVKRYFAGWALENHAINNGQWKHYDLSNYRTHYFTDANVGTSGIELNLQSNAHVRLVYDFTETAPNSVSCNWGYDGPATIISNGSQLASPTPGTCTLIEIEHLSGTRYLVTEHEMSTTYNTTSRYDVEEEP
ncbi:MAG: hypothetical protein J6V72_09195 [Kiritimatiellae bacterium]|nr:hypothetical protein [Kiritimatiellia bacterium]